MNEPMQDSPRGGDGPQLPLPGGRTSNGVPPWFTMAGATLIVAALAIVVVLLVRDDTSTVETIDSTTTLPATTTTIAATTTTAESTASTSEPTTASTTTTTGSSTTTNPDPAATTIPVVYATAVWPWFNSGTRYSDPVEAATGFAVDFIGFDEPTVGPFLQGDSRSGEVEVRPTQDGPATTVFVRQLGDDGTWWVLGSASANIVVEEPSSLCMIESPLTVKGEAFTFEGNVEVQVRADNAADTLAVVPVTGGGTELLPFEGDISFETPASVSGGAIVFLSRSAEDGSVWEASVVRVSFVPTGC